MKSFHNIILGLLIVVCFVSTLFFMHSYRLELINNNSKQKIPNVFVNNALLYQYDNTGTLKHIVKSKKMQQYAKKSFYTDAFFTIYNPNGAVWHITAPYASSDIQAKHFYGWGGVIIKQLPYKGHVAQTIKSFDMHYDTLKDLATTKSHAILLRNHNILQGDGMRANLALGQVLLLSNVRSTYRPQRKPSSS